MGWGGKERGEPRWQIGEPEWEGEESMSGREERMDEVEGVQGWWTPGVGEESLGGREDILCI